MPNSHDLSTLCFVSTVTQLDVMFICRTSLGVPSAVTTSVCCGCGNRISGKADGSLGAGRSKSSLPWLLSNSSLEKASDLVIKRLRDVPCLNLALRSDCGGYNIARPSWKKIKRTAY
ncbi:uncharacterized protein EAF01_006671 [Botrytis porri]|uniref:uncharacterized protein n=1 Tax=Botrytis porri TaxID=87229 RepID=UPI00190256EF|nr:uncharacterized protein EAF01_006671 [Botrytis porri]KAF7903622.1 hypothetical protein EAF01_006671 [Botrytis porri]